jgi:hypothetical protein
MIALLGKDLEKTGSNGHARRSRDRDDDLHHSSRVKKKDHAEAAGT